MRRETIEAGYNKLAVEYELLLQRENRILLILSFARLFVFIMGAVVLWIAFGNGSLQGLLSLVSVVFLFGWLLFIFSAHSLKRDYFNNLVIINKNEVEALSGKIAKFGNGERYVDPAHNFSHDTDIFGDDSLFQFLNRTCTGNGGDILAKWLSDPMQVNDNLHLRQEAVKELSVNMNWSQRFRATGMLNQLNNSDIKSLIDWINEHELNRNGFFSFLTGRILPSLTILVLIFVIFGLLNYSIFVLLFTINLLIVGAQLKKTNSIHRKVAGKYQFLSSTAMLISVFNEKEFSSELLSIMREKLVGTSVSAAKTLKKLSRILQSFDSRLNMLLGLALNGLLLWDLQCVSSLVKWKNASKDTLPEWLDILGQADALISLSNFAFNNPEFVYPVVDEGGKVFEAVELGHPLIAGEKRVNNNFEIVEKGSVYIITGANMAGKSTFLRTVAVNYILAIIGSPVCAGEMRFTPMKIFSGMRTADSLSHSESYFYAELKRLKTLKDMLERGEEIFFLLDEILRGTNSTDKSMGSKLFLKKIISLGGTGIIATHDISLGELEHLLPGKVFNSCFEIEINGEEMIFDYKLRKGITQKMNAAILMKQMGITEESIIYKKK